MTFKERVEKAKQANLSKKTYLDEAEGCAHSTLGRTKFRAWAREIGALRRVGSRNLYDRATIDAAIGRGDAI